MVENPTQKDLRNFKFLLLFFPILPSVILYFKNHVTFALSIVEVCWAILLTLFVARLFGKNIDKAVYKFLKKILQVAGIVVSVIALVITWLFAILPTAFVAKIKGRDRLLLRKPKGSSYWKNVEVSEPTYENQY